jgi:hypothetical protein
LSILHLYRAADGDPKALWAYAQGSVLSWEGDDWLECGQGRTQFDASRTFIEAPLIELFDQQPSLKEAEVWAPNTQPRWHGNRAIQHLWDERRSRYIIDKIEGLNGAWHFLLAWNYHHKTRASLVAIEHEPIDHEEAQKPPRWVKIVRDHFRVVEARQKLRMGPKGPPLWERLGEDLFE